MINHEECEFMKVIYDDVAAVYGGLLRFNVGTSLVCISIYIYP